MKTGRRKPSTSTPVTLRRHKNGVTLLYQGRALTKTHASKVGALQAELRKRGLERVSSPYFSWQRCARQVRAAYRNDFQEYDAERQQFGRLTTETSRSAHRDGIKQ